MVGTNSWREQFIEAITVSAGEFGPQLQVNYDHPRSCRSLAVAVVQTVAEQQKAKQVAELFTASACTRQLIKPFREITLSDG